METHTRRCKYNGDNLVVFQMPEHEHDRAILNPGDVEMNLPELPNDAPEMAADEEHTSNPHIISSLNTMLTHVLKAASGLKIPRYQTVGIFQQIHALMSSTNELLTKYLCLNVPVYKHSETGEYYSIEIELDLKLERLAITIVCLLIEFPTMYYTFTYNL